MARNPKSRKTQGLAQVGFVGKNIAETDDATYALFLANAPVGEIGVFEESGAKHTNLITATEKFFIAQKMTGGTKKTPLIAFNEITPRKTAYTAPVKCKWFLGWTGTTGSMNLAAAPSAGKNYEFSVIEMTEGYVPYPTWNYDYTAKAGDAEVDVALALVKMVNNPDNVIYKNIEPLVTAKALISATYGNFAIGAGGTLAFTLGSDTVVVAVGALTFTVGQYLAFTSGSGTLTDATLTNVYKIIGGDGSTYITLDRPFEEASVTLAEAQVEGTGAAGGSIKAATVITKTGIALTAINNDENFKISRREEYENATATLSAFTKGNGTAVQVALLEDEAATFAGETTQAAKLAEKWGQMDRFTDVATPGTYQMYNIEISSNSDSKAGYGVGKVKSYIAIAAHNSNASFKTYMNTLFGV